MSLYSSLTQVLAPFAAKINGLLTGWDGTRYQTPGEAVRQQIADLHVLIGDVPGEAIAGSAVSYDGTSSDLSATNLQAAVDETNEKFTAVNSRLQRQEAKSNKKVPNSQLDLIDECNFPLELAETLAGKYPANGTVGGKITFSTSESHITKKFEIPVGATSVYSRITPSSLTRITDADGTILAMGASSAEDIPSGAKYLYIAAGTSNPYIGTDDFVWLNNSQFVYATEKTLYSAEHKRFYKDLIAPVSYEQLKSIPQYILTEMDLSAADRNLTFNNTSRNIAAFYSNESNVVCVVNLTASVAAADGRLMYHDSVENAWRTASNVEQITGDGKYTFTCDCASLIQYQNADNFRLAFSGTSGTIVISDLKIYAEGNLSSYDYYDKNFEPMMQKVFEKLDDSTIRLTSPNGTKFRLTVSNNGTLTAVPEGSSAVPNNLLIMGNSLVFGMANADKSLRHGMAATRAEYDYANRFIAYTQAKNPNLVSNKLYSSSFEHSTTLGAAQTFMNDNTAYWNENVDMVIVQMGDNVNTAEKRTVFAESFPLLIDKIKTQSPNAVVVVVGIWFNNSTVFNIMKSTAEQNGCIFVDIRGIRNSETEGELGATVYFADGTTTTVTQARASHPGDLGMERIAEAIENAVSF